MLIYTSYFARRSFPRVAHAGGYSGNYSELLLDHIPPVGETHNCNKYVRVITDDIE